MSSTARVTARISSAGRLPRQHGNTLTGVIIGLVVGLVIAVIVALLITKGSSPFTDKLGKSGKSGLPTEGQVTDPNKPLYGNKDAARAANKEVVAKVRPASDDPLGAAVKAIEAGETPDAKADAKADTKADAKADTKADAKPDVKPDVKPAAPPAADATAANVAPAATTAGEEKITYHLQAGAFRAMEDAENTRAKLALLGFEAAISEKTSDSGVLYRVRIGPFPQPESMNKARAKLIDNGIDVAIVKNQK